MKYSILILIFILLLPAAAAYDLNSSVSIIAEYKDNGVLKNATTKIYIWLPDNTLNVSGHSMSYKSLGRYQYNYTCKVTGQHKVRIDFSNSTSYLGNQSSYLTCGELDKFVWGTCPSGTNGYFGVWIFMALLVALAVVGIVIRSGLISFASGAFLIFLGVITWGCGDIIAYFDIGFGIIFIIVSLVI